MQILSEQRFPAKPPSNFWAYAVAMVVLTVIGGISFFNFLLFHSLVELSSTLIAFSIFIVAWNTRHLSRNNYLLLLGIFYLFIGFLDLLHALSYKGMGVFHGYGADLPTQLWISARYLESVALAVAPLYFTRRANIAVTFWICLTLCSLLILSLFYWRNFPACYIDGTGLTPFKKGSEYVICCILAFGICHLIRRRSHLDPTLFGLIIASMLLTVTSEIAFTFYVSVYGISNIIGHFFKIISFYLIYRAVIVINLTTPYESLFRELMEKEKAREQVIEELRDALAQVKLLQGFLPICASCKQIRDDRGYWNQIESYLSEHSDLVFSHSLCPECAERLYGELYQPEGGIAAG